MQKFRSELSERQRDQEEVHFTKNVFKFVDVNPFDRVTIKLGCFTIPATVTEQEAQLMLSTAELFASGSI